MNAPGYVLDHESKRLMAAMAAPPAVPATPGKPGFVNPFAEG
jgi:hypothetical protein